MTNLSNRGTNRAMVSFFDQFPTFYGVQITIRGDDGYFDATAMSAAMEAFDGKRHRFSDWTRYEPTKRLLSRLNERSGIPITYDDLDPRGSGSNQKPLIDWVPGRGSRTWIHPYVALSYAMSVPEFQADVNIWIVDLLTLGTVNPHHLRWTQEEYLRGLQYNRDDINDMYGR